MQLGMRAYIYSTGERGAMQYTQNTSHRPDHMLRLCDLTLILTEPSSDMFSFQASAWCELVSDMQAITKAS